MNYMALIVAALRLVMKRHLDPDRPPKSIDIEVSLDRLAADETEKDLNWRESIMDLMELLGLDARLKARKKLAQELGYSGPLDGSVAMNTWLHEQVLQKVREHNIPIPSKEDE